MTMRSPVNGGGVWGAHDCDPGSTVASGGLDARSATRAAGRRPCSGRGAPRLPCHAFGAPLHARETHTTLDAGRVGAVVSLRSTRVSFPRLRRGARGYAPRLTAGPLAGLSRLGPRASSGSPQALHRPRWGAVRFRGRRAAGPSPTLRLWRIAAPDCMHAPR